MATNFKSNLRKNGGDVLPTRRFADRRFSDRPTGRMFRRQIRLNFVNVQMLSILSRSACLTDGLYYAVHAFLNFSQW